MTDLVKVFFTIVPDSDGYPSVGTESVWAKSTNVSNQYEIDNIPFFIREAAFGDILIVDIKDEVLWFNRVIECSSNSLIRVVFFDRDALDRLSNSLLSLGCQTEYSKDFNLLAVSIPRTADLRKVQAYLKSEQEIGSIDFEEPILRG